MPGRPTLNIKEIIAFYSRESRETQNAADGSHRNHSSL